MTKTIKKEKMSLFSKQNGITLIALVITIVVLLILAGVSINALFGDNGIIKSAQNAKNKINEAEQNDLAQINELNNWLENQAGISNSTGGSTPNPPTTTLPTTEDTSPYYPDDTFKTKPDTNLDDGLVIEDAIGNEYVWIEVPKSLYNNGDYNTETETADKKPANSEDYDKIEYCLHKYTDYYRRDKNGNLTECSDTYSSEKATGLTSTQYTQLKQKMLKSIYENGGFWIGRYEAGVIEQRYDGKTPIVAPISKKSTAENKVYPYDMVEISQAQTVANMLTTANYTSSLMFGVQWDLVLKHIETKEVKKGIALATIQNELRTDSSNWGKYSKFDGNNEETTGSKEAYKKMNIYDLAGNAWEWTLEWSLEPSTDDPCVTRGGADDGSGGEGTDYPAAVRKHEHTDRSQGAYGFRVSLYK